MKQELLHYLQQQLRTTDERLKRFTQSLDGTEYPKRFMFERLHGYIDDFLNKKPTNKMVIMPGFRGVGKTTLMSQLCAEYKTKVTNVLFLSVEDAKNLFNAGIAELMSAYEEILGNDLESVQDPILIFLDEVQSDEKWAITLKSLFEKTTNIFFCCTGSASVILQTTPNLARRAVFEKLPPMCFSEYEMTRNGIYPPKGIKDEIREALYFSEDVGEAYNKLLSMHAKVNQYWSQINRLDVRKYLAYGSLPFSFGMPNETAIYDAVSLLLDKLIHLDLPTLGSFDIHTLGAVKRILFTIAESDTVSLIKLEERLGINRLTISSLFDALEKAELLIKVPPYGANMTIAKKANKYLFMSPAIRMSFFYFTGMESTYLMRQGKLLEDSVGAHLNQEFISKGQGILRYDSQEGGADFILQLLNNKQIIIEVGMGTKDKKQIINSAKKVNSDYNLIFSTTELRADHDRKILFVPLDYYFLM